MGLTAEEIEFAYVIEGLSYKDIMNREYTIDWKNAEGRTKFIQNA
jgi:hypothetical protein